MVFRYRLNRDQNQRTKQPLRWFGLNHWKLDERTKEPKNQAYSYKFSRLGLPTPLDDLAQRACGTCEFYRKSGSSVLWFFSCEINAMSGTTSEPSPKPWFFGRAEIDKHHHIAGPYLRRWDRNAIG